MKDKEFCQLHDVAIGSNDEVMIIQSSNCVLVFDKKLNLLTKITEKDYIRLFHGTIKDNIIALSDINCDQVIKYSIEGKKLSVIGDGNGSEDGQFNTPRGLAFSGDKLLVVDGDNHRVQVFKQNNDFSFSFGSKGQGPGQFQQPVKIAVDRNANILVSDQVANCIHIFNGEGNFVHKIVHACQQPHAVVVTPMGFLITTHNTENNKITIRKPATYEVINQFGNRGERQGEFDEVGGIAIDSCGNIYMVESKNKRIQMIRND